MEKIKIKKESTKAKNKRFWALQKRDQRVAVARDVIELLESKKIIAERGTYVKINTHEDIQNQKMDTLLAKPDITCICCGLGALFTGVVDMGDKVNVSDVFKNEEWWGRSEFYGNQIDDSKMREKLREVFSPDQLGLIESAFEGKLFRDNEGKTSPEFEKLRRFATAFGKRYKNDEERMKAIMKNIIKNRGTFRPDKP